MSDEIQEVKADEESVGVKSSKRVAGLWLSFLGASFLIGLGSYSATVLHNLDVAFSCGLSVMVLGSSLLGVTVFENIFKK